MWVWKLCSFLQLSNFIHAPFVFHSRKSYGLRMTRVSKYSQDYPCSQLELNRCTHEDIAVSLYAASLVLFDPEKSYGLQQPVHAHLMLPTVKRPTAWTVFFTDHHPVPAQTNILDPDVQFLHSWTCLAQFHNFPSEIWVIASYVVHFHTPVICVLTLFLRDNASLPKTSFYSNPCSRCIKVRKALAHALNELQDFQVFRVQIQDDQHKWKDQRKCRSYM